MAQFGKHFSRLFVHFFIRPEGNFYEFGLHHTLSVFLIIFSYLMDHWLIGCFVLLIHDSTDMTLIFARAYKVKHEISLGLQISFGNGVAVPFRVCHFDMDHLQNFYFRLRLCLRNGLQYYKRTDTKTGGTIGENVHGHDVLPSVFHVRNAESVASVTVLLDVLHRAISDCIAKGGHTKL